MVRDPNWGWIDNARAEKSNLGENVLSAIIQNKMKQGQARATNADELQNAIALAKAKISLEQEARQNNIKNLQGVLGGGADNLGVNAGGMSDYTVDPNYAFTGEGKPLMLRPDVERQRKVADARALEEGKPLSAESAGKLAMVTQAESDLNEAENLLFPGGKFSPGMAFQTNFPGGGVPRTEGRQAFSKVLNAVNAKLRIETGAQANPSEVRNILERFLPTVRDSEETAKDKFRRLKEFMATTKSIIDPRGRFNQDGLNNNQPAFTGGRSAQPAFTGGGDNTNDDPLGLR
jgi:hypothetical protein